MTTAERIKPSKATNPRYEPQGVQTVQVGRRTFEVPYYREQEDPLNPQYSAAFYFEYKTTAGTWKDVQSIGFSSLPRAILRLKKSIAQHSEVRNPELIGRWFADYAF